MELVGAVLGSTESSPSSEAAEWPSCSKLANWT
jgi:hypothetical protein